MDKLILNINDDIMDALKKVKEAQSPTVYVDLPEKSVLFENSLNLKVIRKEAAKHSKDVVFETTDPVGKNLIEALDAINPNRVDHDSGFVTQSKSFATGGSSSVPSPTSATGQNQPSHTTQHITSISNLQPESTIQDAEVGTKVTESGHVHQNPLRSPKKGMGFFAKFFIGVGLMLLLILAFGLYYVFFVLPSAKVKLTVSSEPLVRSVTVNLSVKESEVDAKNRSLPGKSLEASVDVTKEGVTTGEAIVGEKAKGEVTIINKTNSETKIKKGTVVSLVSSKETLRFTLDSDVTVPKLTTTTTTNPDGTGTTTTETYGKADVKVTAENIGSKYNVDDDKNFKVSGKDTDDFIATNDKKFSGGSSKTVKAVAQVDLDNLSKDAFAESKDQISTSLRSKISSKEKLLDSSIVYKKGTETFDKKVNDQSDKVTVKQTVSATGLFYSQADLQKLLDDLLKEFVPDGFEISEKDQDIEVGVLTAVNQTEPAESIDLQVKIKAYIIPVVDEKSIKARLKGAKVDSGRKYLSEIKNINSYEIDLWPKLTTFLGRFPSSEERIEVTIDRK